MKSVPAVFTAELDEPEVGMVIALGIRKAADAVGSSESSESPRRGLVI